MADYWKSQAKYYCATCNSYMADNKVTREKHEQGRRHQENVEQKLKEIRRKTMQDEREQKLMDDCFRKMEEATKQTESPTATTAAAGANVVGSLPQKSESTASAATTSGYKRGDSDPTTLSQAAAAAAAAAQAAAAAAFNPLDWKESTTADGRKYYWNVKTRETSWEKPQPRLATTDAKPAKKSTKIRLLGSAAAKPDKSDSHVAEKQQAAEAAAAAVSQTQSPLSSSSSSLTSSIPTGRTTNSKLGSATHSSSNYPVIGTVQSASRPIGPFQGPPKPSGPFQSPARPSGRTQIPSKPSVPASSSSSAEAAKLKADIKQEAVEYQAEVKKEEEEEATAANLQPIRDEESAGSQPIKGEPREEAADSSISSSNGIGQWTLVERQESQSTVEMQQQQQHRRPQFNFEERTLASGSLKRASDSQSAACTFKRIKQPSATTAYTRISSGD